jgi:hypothetical protein
MLDILLHHRDRFKAWHPDDPITRQLQLLVEARRWFVADQGLPMGKMQLLRC